MTALIYKAALPTYTSAEALAANADENLVLNDAGTAYELEPGQSGASVADSRWEGYAENGATLAQNGAPPWSSNIIDFAKDIGAGTDINFNAGAHAFEIGQAGLYIVVLYCYLAPAQGSTGLWLSILAGAGSNVVGGVASSMPAVALVDGGGATCTQWIRTAQNSTFKVIAGPVGGTAPEVVDVYGAAISIARAA